MIETSLKEVLEKEAKLEEISLAELCKEKFRYEFNIFFKNNN